MLRAALLLITTCLLYVVSAQGVAYKVELQRRTRLTSIRPGAAASIQRRTVSSDLLFSSSSILAPLQVGSPAQQLLVLLDTSSSDLAVFGADYASQYTSEDDTAPQVGRKAFDSSNSTTFKRSENTFQNNYGSGSSSATYFRADYAYDTVAFRGLTLAQQPIGVIQSGNVSYGQQASGIMGLAFEAASLGLRATPPIQQLVFNKALKAPLFTFALMRPSSDFEQADATGEQTEPGGLFTLGFLDGDQYQGALGWSDLVTTMQSSDAPYKWLATLDSISVNGVTVANSQGLVANFDTGSSVSRASPQLIDAIVSQSQSVWKDSDGNYFVPCGDSLPSALNVSITMGGVTVAIEPMDLLYKTAQLQTDDGQSYCYSTLTPTDSDEYDIQIGDDMMRSLFLAFSFNPPRVGMAQQSANVHNQGALPVFSFTATRSLDYGSLIRPQPTGFSRVQNVKVAAGSAVTHQSDVGGTAIAPGGTYVASATPTMQTMAASVTPTQIGSVNSQSIVNSDPLQGVERNPATVSGQVSVIQATNSGAAPSLSNLLGGNGLRIACISTLLTAALSLPLVVGAC
jgi:cathepsin D